MPMSCGQIPSPSATYQAALEAYWAAQTPEEERLALAVMQRYERVVQDSDAPYSFWLGRDAEVAG